MTDTTTRFMRLKMKIDQRASEMAKQAKADNAIHPHANSAKFTRKEWIKRLHKERRSSGACGDPPIAVAQHRPLFHETEHPGGDPDINSFVANICHCLAPRQALAMRRR